MPPARPRSAWRAVLAFPVVLPASCWTAPAWGCAVTTNDCRRVELNRLYGGKNPSTLSREILEQLLLTCDGSGGIEERARRSILSGNSTVLTALRARCLDCCCWQPREVSKCTAISCVSWPFRMGRNPFRKHRTLSDKQRAALDRGRGGSN